MSRQMPHGWTYRRRLILSIALVALLALPTLGTGAAAASKRLTQVTVKDFGTRLIIGIVSSGPVLFNVTEIAAPAPPRVAIDLLDTIADERVRTTTEVRKGNVLRVRVGQFRDSPAVARVVIDLVEPVAVEVARSGSNTLVVGVPVVPVTEVQARTAAAAPVPVRPPAAAAATASPAADLVPAVSAAPGTGVVRVAQATERVPGGAIRLLEFRGVPLADVLSALARLCGFNLVTDGSVTGTVTLRLVDVTCEDALRFILEANNLAFRRLGRNLIIGSAERLAPPPETPETIAYRLAYGDPNQIRAAVAAAVPGIRVAIDPRTNALLITGTTAQHEEVRKVLGTLDVRIAQVVIQLHAIEVSTSVLRELGLLVTPDGTVGSLGSFFLDSTSNRIGFTVTNSTLLQNRLRALVTEGRAHILSAPRIATLDGNKASILLGDRVPIFTVTTQGGVTTTTVTFVEVGVKMDVTPRVNVDGVITLSVTPEVSSVAEIVTGAGGQQAPRVATRSATTTLAVKDGQTIVLGGLISREERQTLIKIPLLGDIPVIGELFRFRTNDRRESEVVFLITPQIAQD
ncbi:MAG TPA: secretin N-terminal domain-containing protein [bacterium]|nr:secretin N-terminal domain-containing protein [bacterium]